MTALLIVLIFLPIVPASGEWLSSDLPVAVVEEERDRLVLDRYLGIFQDPEGRLTIDDVSGWPATDRFVYPGSKRQYYGYTDHAYWVKAVLQPRIAAETTRMLEIENPSLNRIDLYVKSADQIERYTTGDRFSFDERLYRHRKFVFPLHLTPGQPVEIYARIEAGGSMYFPMTVWEQGALQERQLIVETGWGLYLGWMAAMSIYHLMMFAFIRNGNDLLYAALILIIGLFQMADSGLAYVWLWPEWPEWNERAPNVLAAAGMMIIALLGRNLLQSGGRIVRFYDRAYLTFAGILAGCLPLFGFVAYADGMLVLKLLFLPFFALSLLVVATALREKSQGARYYAIALAGLFAGVIVSIFKGPVLPANLFTENAIKLGSLFFVMTLSFGVGANLQRLQRESGRERQKRMQLELLYECSLKMAATLDPGEIGDIVLTGLKEMLGAKSGQLLSSAGQASDPIGEAVRDVVERVGPDRKPVILSDSVDLSPLGFPKERGRFVAVPVVNHGQLLALAILQMDRNFKASESDLQPAAMLAAQAGRALVNAQMFMEKDQLAMLDELTGLLNRRAFFERARSEYQKAVVSGKPLSVMMIDADDFKQINDTYGHAAGDRLLKKLAGILRDNFKGKDVIGRYGGEEFSVVMPNTELHEAMHLADRLRGEVEKEGKLDGIPRFTVSIGVTTASLAGEDEDSLSEALLRADQALYAAKRNGRNRVVSRDTIPFVTE